VIAIGLYAAVAFALGAMPFALWVGRAALGVDIRDYGDGNPGTFNVMRAGGGLTWTGLALMLDISKSAAPTGFAVHVLGVEGWPLVIIALAPVLGHMFSPFLTYRGGKAIAATGGMFIGLSLLELPIVGLPLLVVWYVALTSSGWAVMLTDTGVIAYILLADRPPEWLIIMLILSGLLAYKHRDELHHWPRLRLLARGETA
jgi:acyl phosphate:glycerol-3-phosphate acyltransferase